MHSFSRVRVFVLALLLFSIPAAMAAQVSVGISVHIGPPSLPVYSQPVCPGPGYVWLPGYWAWSPQAGEYYWVPGTWELAPAGMLWTPGYWSFESGVYLWHPGYWGPHVGFYGGINYGFGYTGVGFVGGYWDHGHYFYNRAVTNVNVVNVTNVYNRSVVVNNVNRVSFNGPGGITRGPSHEELAFAHERHMQPLASQMQHEHQAALNRASFVSANHGAPGIAATPRPGAFNDRGVIHAGSAGPVHGAPSPSVHGPVNNPHSVNNSSGPMNRGGNSMNRGGNPGMTRTAPAPRPGNTTTNNNSRMNTANPRMGAANNERNPGLQNSAPRNTSSKPRPVVGNPGAREVHTANAGGHANASAPHPPSGSSKQPESDEHHR